MITANERQIPLLDLRAQHKQIREEVLEVLTQQLGHRAAEARQMVEQALKRNPGIASAEDLFQEVYRAERGVPA